MLGRDWQTATSDQRRVYGYVWIADVNDFKRPAMIGTIFLKICLALTSENFQNMQM